MTHGAYIIITITIILPAAAIGDKTLKTAMRLFAFCLLLPMNNDSA